MGTDCEAFCAVSLLKENETIDSNEVIEEVELKSNAKNETKKNIDIGLENEKNKKENVIDSELISSIKSMVFQQCSEQFQMILKALLN